MDKAIDLSRDQILSCVWVSAIHTVACSDMERVMLEDQIAREKKKASE